MTVPVVDQFIADLKDAVGEAKLSPSGKGIMMTLYGACRPFHFTMSRAGSVNLPRVVSGLGQSSPVGSTMVGHVAEAFLDTLYKA